MVSETTTTAAAAPGTEAMEVEESDVDAVSLERLREQIRLIERGEAAKETSYVNRVLRQLLSTRKALNDAVLGRLTYAVIPNSSHLSHLRGFLDETALPSKATLDGDRKAELKSHRSAAQLNKATAAHVAGGGDSSKASGGVGLEVELYIHLLFVVFLLDKKRLEEAEKCVLSLVNRVETEGSGRGSLSALAARIFFYHALIQERLGRLASLQPWLHKRLTLASLSHEEEVEAVLINALLRSYLTQHLYQPALKLVAKVRFPESAGSNEWARHLYYLGTMKTMETQYADAHKYLKEALAKAPKDTALGFKQRVTKALVVVELLEASEFPERSLFREPQMRRCLRPYLRLTKAVRVGDVGEFQECLKDNESQFLADGTLAWIRRLGQKVIRTAMRQISLAYSRIPIQQVQKKLRLPSPDDAEYILTKAANEGVLEGYVDHEAASLVLGECSNVYGTAAPAALLHTRTGFCLKLEQQAVKAMRFPPKSYLTQLQSAEEQREREAAELELAKEMEEEDDF